MPARASRFGPPLADIVRGPPDRVPEHAVAGARGPDLGAHRGALPVAGRGSDLAPCCLHRRGREMYCRNVYLRTGLVMPRAGWVVDLGANHGLFSVWAAMAGAQVVAVEAQQGFAPIIGGLAAHNGVAARVRVETAIAGGVRTPGAT